MKEFGLVHGVFGYVKLGVHQSVNLKFQFALRLFKSPKCGTAWVRRFSLDMADN